MDERYFLRILLGTSVSPKSAEELSRIYRVPMGLCTAILDVLERRGYVANMVTLFPDEGKPVKYYVRTEMKLRDLTEDEVLPAMEPLTQSP